GLRVQIERAGVDPLTMPRTGGHDDEPRKTRAADPVGRLAQPVEPGVGIEPEMLGRVGCRPEAQRRQHPGFSARRPQRRAGAPEDLRPDHLLDIQRQSEAMVGDSEDRQNGRRVGAPDPRGKRGGRKPRPVGRRIDVGQRGGFHAGQMSARRAPFARGNSPEDFAPPTPGSRRGSLQTGAAGLCCARPMATPPVIVWFRQDLRLADNPALAAAVKRGGPVIPVYIHDEAGAGDWPAGGASRWWLHHSLTALDAALRARGSRLILAAGESAAVLDGLVSATGADAVYWNRCYEPAAIARDKSIKSALTSAGVQAASFNAALLFEPHTITNRQGNPFQVFTPYWR